MNKYHKQYKIQLLERELALINMHEGDTKRKKLMSVYVYLLKNADNKELRLSFGKLHKMYNYSHRKELRMALSTIKKAVSRLIDLGLLKIVAVVRKVNVYSFVRFNFNEYVPNKVTDNVTCGKVVEDIENTDLRESVDCTNSIKQEVNIDIENKSDSDNEKSYEEFIESEAKVDKVETVINKANELFKLMKIKDELVKSKVINQLTNVYSTITVKFLNNYIEKTIRKTVLFCKSARMKAIQERKENKAQSMTFNNFDQRVYNYDILEKGLTGEIAITSSEDYNLGQNTEIKVKNKLKFKNFDEREHQNDYYKDLENKLLGWE